jgi:hypothetical protein
MAEQELITFRKLAHLEEAEALVNIFKSRSIQADYRKLEGDLGGALQGSIDTFKYEVRILESSRSKAEEILEKMAFEELEDVDKDHYLYEFTDEELIDVLVRREEWNEIDYVLSRKILKDRGVKYNQEEIEVKHKEYIAKISEPKGGQGIWIFIGYITAIVGGFFGLLIGYMLFQAKTVLPNGSRVPAYTPTTRNHGKYIFFLSIVMLIILGIMRFFTTFFD